MSNTFKVRRPQLNTVAASFTGGVSFSSPIKLGTSGISFANLYAGSCVAEVPAIAASAAGAVSGCITVTGVPTTAHIFVQIKAASAGVFVTSASMLATGLCECNYGKAGHAATGACSFSAQYLAITPA